MYNVPCYSYWNSSWKDYLDVYKITDVVMKSIARNDETTKTIICPAFIFNYLYILSIVKRWLRAAVRIRPDRT